MATTVIPAIAGTGVQWALDSSGNPVGLVGPDGRVSQFGITPEIVQQYRSGQPWPKKARLTDPGFAWYYFSDHTQFTLSGSTTGWTASTVSGVDGIAYDSSGSRSSSSSMVKFAADGSQSGTLTATVPAYTAVSINKKFGCWVYYSPDSANTGTSLTINVVSGTTFAAEKACNFNNHQLRFGWNFLVFDGNQASHPFGVSTWGGDVVNSTQRFRLEITMNGGACSLYFDSLWSGWSIDKPRVMLGMDSTGTISLSQYFLSIMQEYGLRGYANHSYTALATTARISDFGADASGNSGQIARIDQLYDAGFDVINHTLNHTNIDTGVTDAEIIYLLNAQRDWQLGHGWVRGSEFFSTAQGLYTAANEVIVRRLGWVKAVRSVRHHNMTPTLYGYDNLFHCGAISLDDPVSGTATYSNWVSLLSKNIAYGGDVWVFGHDIIAGGAADGETATGVSTQIYETSFRLFCAWLAAQQAAGAIQVVTPSEWYYGIDP